MSDIHQFIVKIHFLMNGPVKFMNYCWKIEMLETCVEPIGFICYESHYSQISFNDMLNIRLLHFNSHSLSSVQFSFVNLSNGCCSKSGFIEFCKELTYFSSKLGFDCFLNFLIISRRIVIMQL